MTLATVGASAVAACEGALALAGTPSGQMATAVLVVLLAWAVLSKRVYVVELTNEDVLSEILVRLGLAEVALPSAEPQRRSSSSGSKNAGTYSSNMLASSSSLGGGIERDASMIAASESPSFSAQQQQALLRHRQKGAKSDEALSLLGDSSCARLSGSEQIDSQKPTRRRSGAKSAGTEAAFPEKKKFSVEEVHASAGFAARDAETQRLLWREGTYWSEPDPAGLKIRGPSYLMDKVKILAGQPLFKLLDCDLFGLERPTQHLARYLTHRIDKLWSESGFLDPTTRPYTVVIQLQVPGPPHKAFVMYFGIADRDVVFDSDTPFSRVASRFFAPKHTTATSGDATLHKWRNNTFKLIPRCVNAPFVVKRAVGEVPTLLGNKLAQGYYGADDYFEVDVNISSSRIAQYTVGLALNYASVVICDLAFVLQGASPAELPEALVGCMRIEHIVIKDSTPLDIPASSNNGNNNTANNNHAIERATALA